MRAVGIVIIDQISPRRLLNGGAVHINHTERIAIRFLNPEQACGRGLQVCLEGKGNKLLRRPQYIMLERVILVYLIPFIHTREIRYWCLGVSNPVGNNIIVVSPEEFECKECSFLFLFDRFVSNTVKTLMRELAQLL